MPRGRRSTNARRERIELGGELRERIGTEQPRQERSNPAARARTPRASGSSPRATRTTSHHASAGNPCARGGRRGARPGARSTRRPSLPRATRISRPPSVVSVPLRALGDRHQHPAAWSAGRAPRRRRRGSLAPPRTSDSLRPTPTRSRPPARHAEHEGLRKCNAHARAVALTRRRRWTPSTRTGYRLGRDRRGTGRRRDRRSPEPADGPRQAREEEARRSPARCPRASAASGSGSPGSISSPSGSTASAAPCPRRSTPRPWLYFSQVAALFVNAAPKVIDYRAEGWSCTEHRWIEIDVRPYFRIDADNKENRFQRALQFYRKNRNGDARARGLHRRAPQRDGSLRSAACASRAFASRTLRPASTSRRSSRSRSRLLGRAEARLVLDAEAHAGTAALRERSSPTTTAPGETGRRSERRPRRTTIQRAVSRSILSSRMFVGDRFFSWLKKPRARRAARAHPHLRAARDPRLHVRAASPTPTSGSATAASAFRISAYADSRASRSSSPGAPDAGRRGRVALRSSRRACCRARLPGAPRRAGSSRRRAPFVALSDRLAAFSVSKMTPVVAHRARAVPVRRALRHRRVARRRGRAEDSAPARGRERLGPLLPDPPADDLTRASGIAKARGDWLTAAVRPLDASPQLVPDERDAFLANLLPPFAWTAASRDDADARGRSRRSGSA